MSSPTSKDSVFENHNHSNLFCKLAPDSESQAIWEKLTKSIQEKNQNAFMEIICRLSVKSLIFLQSPEKLDHFYPLPVFAAYLGVDKDKLKFAIYESAGFLNCKNFCIIHQNLILKKTSTELKIALANQNYEVVIDILQSINLRDWHNYDLKNLRENINKIDDLNIKKNIMKIIDDYDVTPLSWRR